MAQRSRRLIGCTFALAAALTACSTEDTGNATTSVNVTLQEFAVVPGQSTAAAGSVTFITKNIGPNDPHELVVFKSDLVPTALPLAENGGVDESGAGLTLIGEIEEFPVGETREGTFTLTAGKYVLVCNIVDTDETPTEVHYKLGMLASFTVT